MYKWLASSIIISLLATGMSGCASVPGKPAASSSVSTYTAADVDTRIVIANNAFGLKLFQELAGDGSSNIMISPASIAAALAMTYNGAGGSTQVAMEEALQLQGLTLAEINEGNKILKQVLEHADPSVELSIANSLWAREGKPFHEAFLAANRDHFDAEVTSLDLLDPETPDVINGWVEEKTKGKIKEIIKGPIDPATVLFLINAIYFKGEWTHPFQERATADGEFVTADGSSVTVPMMSQYGEFEYKEGEGYQAVRLPYGERAMRMAVYLPQEDSSLDAMVTALFADPGLMTGGFATTEGNLRLPRFKLEYEAELEDALTALGIGVAFEPSGANFENRAPIPPNLYIARVKHKSFIEVNEKGSEAAAATVVEVAEESAPANMFAMDVNRPFFFTIEDGETGTVLFMGSVANPAAAAGAAAE